MRKIVLILTCVTLVLCLLCACSAKKQEFEDPVSFYFAKKEISYNSSTGVLYPEIREGKTFHNNLIACLRAYMLGPDSTELQRLIPSDVYLVSCEQEEDVVNLVMSNQFSQLSGIELSTACSALLLTIHDYTGATTMNLSVKDGLVDGKDVFALSMDDIVLIDVNKE